MKRLIILLILSCFCLSPHNGALKANEEQEERPRTRSRSSGIGISIDISSVLMQAGKKKKKKDIHTMEIANPVCHCQGGRLLIIAGVFDLKSPENPMENKDRYSRRMTDKDILGTLKWAKKQGIKHLHTVAYSAPYGNNPIEMDKPFELSSGSWKPVNLGLEKPSPKDASIALAKQWQNCCYFDEVIIIMHGSAYAYPRLIENLPYLLDGKPVRKFVIWSCKSSRKLFPNDIGDSRFYQKMCGIVRPKNCPCECDFDKCVAKDADGIPGGKCPTANDKTLIYAAFAAGGTAAKLGLDTRKEGEASPFTSPDGRIREISVNPDGGISAKAVNSATTPTDIFAGRKLKADPDLFTPGEKVNEKGLLDKSKIIEPPEVESSVPKACAGKEGCKIEAQ